MDNGAWAFRYQITETPIKKVPQLLMITLIFPNFISQRILVKFVADISPVGVVTIHMHCGGFFANPVFYI